MPQEPISVSGVWLDAHSGRIRVRVEIERGKWVTIVDECNDEGHISHIVEPDGIRACADQAESAPDLQ